MDIENLAYHRKYRPSTLKQYKGMKKIKETVMKAIASDNRPQTMLLYGDSGCGKTTLARIIAKEYNCYDRDAENGACGICSNCVAMDEYIATGDTGMLGNVNEVDIGDNSRKDALEGVLSDVDIAPIGDEWKIYIFDEIQSASVGLQNRLLKLLEEPPEHVLFMFCTTNPEKLLPTLKNRCQLHLHITKPSLGDLVSLLKDVCNTEGVAYDKRGLEFIANRSNFVMRDALRNLETVVREQNSAEYQSATKVFEEVSNTQIVRLLRALKKRDTFEYVTCLCEVKTKMDLSLFLSEVKGFVTRGVYIANGLPVEGVSENEYSVYSSLFSTMPVEELGNLMDSLLNISQVNLELDLLMLGYRGLKKHDVETVESGITEIDDELALEQKNAHDILKAEEKQSYEQGVENAESLMNEIDFDTLLQMGGKMID